MWSITRTLTGAFVDSSLRPSCSFTASRKVVTWASDGFPSAGGGAFSGVHSIVKSYLPLSPVRSTTGRVKPSGNEVRDDASNSSVVLREPPRTLLSFPGIRPYDSHTRGKMSCLLVVDVVV